MGSGMVTKTVTVNGLTVKITLKKKAAPKKKRGRPPSPKAKAEKSKKTGTHLKGEWLKAGTTVYRAVIKMRKEGLSDTRIKSLIKKGLY